MTPATRTRPDQQIEIFEETIENTDLERVLEERETVKARRAAVGGEFKTVNDRAQSLIHELELEPDTIIRCGRFKITRRTIQARAVAFETETGERITITPFD